MTTTILIAPCKTCGADVAYVETECPECGSPTCAGWTHVAGIRDEPFRLKNGGAGSFDGHVYRKQDSLRLLLLGQADGNVAGQAGAIARWAEKNIFPHFTPSGRGAEVFLYLLDGTTCPAQVQMMPVPPGVTTDIVSRIEPYPAFFRETGIEEIPGKPPQWKIGRQEKFDIPGAPRGTLWQPVSASP